jgi:hypothetical protein
LQTPTPLDHLKPVSKHGKVMAVSMMKDEAPYLLEWIAHHLAIGFTDILVYTNDCTDGTVEMLQRLEVLGLAHHRDNVIAKGKKPQPSAIGHAEREPLVAEADWLIVFDADEFLCINHPSGTLEGMLDDTVALGANGIVITWRIFGSSGIVHWSRAPVTEQYTRAAPPLWNKGWGVKTLFRYDPAHWKLGIHRPSIRNKWLETDFPDSVRWLNGSGRPMEDYFKFRGWRSIRRTVGYDWAQMNHYAVKSVEAYAIRRFRGNVNDKKDKYSAEYWALQDRNEVEDRAILRHAPRRAAIMEALLSDPVLSELHHAALDRVEARLDAFRRTGDYADLRRSLAEASKVPITRVEARPPKPRDPERIAALMSRVERQASEGGKPDRTAPPAAGWAGGTGDPYLPGAIDLSAEVPVEWVENHGIALPADPRLLAPDALNAILAGRFERRHARNIARYLEGHGRLLEIGTGLAFIPLRALSLIEGLSVMAQDGRAALIEQARRVAARAGRDGTPRLTLSADPLRLPGDAPRSANGLAAMLARFRPTVLRLARPEDVAPRLLARQDLSPLTRILLPFAAPDRAEALRAAYGPDLCAAGFAEVEGRDAGGTLQFDRAPP